MRTYYIFNVNRYFSYMYKNKPFKMYKIFEEIYYSKSYDSLNTYRNFETVAVPFNKTMLNEYKTALELVYSEYNNLEYYDNTVTLKDNKLTTITKVNYEKLDINKFISIDKNNKELFNNNKVNLSTLKKIYKKNGAKCKYI